MMQEPKEFNDFLHHLCEFSQERNLTRFCEFLASKELTLISKTEAVDRLYISILIFLFFFAAIQVPALSSFVYLFFLLCMYQLFNRVFFFFFFGIFLASSEVSDDEARTFLIKPEPKMECT